MNSKNYHYAVAINIKKNVTMDYSAHQIADHSSKDILILESYKQNENVNNI